MRSRARADAADASIGRRARRLEMRVYLAHDPSNARRLWTGSNVVWRTTNAASQWVQASAPLFGTTSAVAIFPGDGNRVIVGTSIGAIAQDSGGMDVVLAFFIPAHEAGNILTDIQERIPYGLRLQDPADDDVRPVKCSDD